MMDLANIRKNPMGKIHIRKGVYMIKVGGRKISRDRLYWQPNPKNFEAVNENQSWLLVIILQII